MEEDKNSQEEQSQHASEAAEQIYTKFSDFVSQEKVSKDGFLKDNPMYVTKSELTECFKLVSFPITNEEIESVMKHHNAEKTDYLLIDDFLSKLSCWRSDATPKEMDTHIDLHINNLRDKAKKEKAKPAEVKKPKLKVKGGSRKQIIVNEKPTPLEDHPKRIQGNKSKQYLKKAKEKEIEQERALAMNVEKCKKELEFD
jgi:hypothetical protein